LLAAGFYDRVHIDLFELRFCKRIFAEPMSIPLAYLFVKTACIGLHNAVSASIQFPIQHKA